MTALNAYFLVNNIFVISLLITTIKTELFNEYIWFQFFVIYYIFGALHLRISHPRILANQSFVF